MLRAPITWRKYIFLHNGDGVGTPPDEYKARLCFEEAAALNHAAAQSQLAEYHFYGKGDLRKNEVTALKYYKLSAENGDSRGQCNLGMFYENGMAGLASDIQEASRLYHLAADQGYAPAQNNLATLYEYGRGRRKDLSKALMLYKLAAEAGNKQASHNYDRIQKLLN